MPKIAKRWFMVSVKSCLFLITLILIPFIPIKVLSEPPVTNQEILKEIPLPPELEDPVHKEAEHPDRFFNEFLNMLFTLGIIIFFLLVLSWFVKRMTNTRMQQINESSSIKILDRRSITAKSAVYILEIKGKTIAIAESSNGLIRLADFPTADWESKEQHE